MTEKRFVYCFEGIEDKWETIEEYKYTPCTKDGFQDLCEMLNELNEENQGLRNFKEKSDKFTKEVEKFFKKHNIDTVNFDLIEEEFELYRKENKELKKQLRREETDKKRLMSYLMRYKGFGFDEIVDDYFNEPYYDNWWEDGFYERCWNEYLKEKGFDGCAEE